MTSKFVPSSTLSSGMKSLVLDIMNGRHFVFLLFRTMLFFFVYLIRSSSWGCRIDLDFCWVRWKRPWYWGGPIILSFWTRLDNDIFSINVRSSTNDFLLVLLVLWQSGSCSGAGAGRAWSRLSLSGRGSSGLPRGWNSCNLGVVVGWCLVFWLPRGWKSLRELAGVVSFVYL